MKMFLENNSLENLSEKYFFLCDSLISDEKKKLYYRSTFSLNENYLPSFDLSYQYVYSKLITALNKGSVFKERKVIFLMEDKKNKSAIYIDFHNLKNYLNKNEITVDSKIIVFEENINIGLGIVIQENQINLYGWNLGVLL